MYIKTLKEILIEEFSILKETVDTFTEDTKFEDIGIDSLDAFSLLQILENVYDIKFNNKFTPLTIGEIIEEIRRLQQT